MKRAVAACLVLLIAIAPAGCLRRAKDPMDAQLFAKQVAELTQLRERAEGLLRTAADPIDAARFYEVEVKPRGNALTTHLALLTQSGLPLSCDTKEDPGCVQTRLEQLSSAIDEFDRRGNSDPSGGSVATILLWKPVVDWIVGAALKGQEMWKGARMDERARIEALLKGRAEEIRRAGTFRSARDVLEN